MPSTSGYNGNGLAARVSPLMLAAASGLDEPTLAIGMSSATKATTKATTKAGKSALIRAAARDLTPLGTERGRVRKLTVAQIKLRLKEAGAPLGGSKAVLVERLLALGPHHHNQQQAAPNKQHQTAPSTKLQQRQGLHAAACGSAIKVDGKVTVPTRVASKGTPSAMPGPDTFSSAATTSVTTNSVSRGGASVRSLRRKRTAASVPHDQPDSDACVGRGDGATNVAIHADDGFESAGSHEGNLTIECDGCGADCTSRSWWEPKGQGDYCAACHAIDGSGSVPQRNGINVNKSINAKHNLEQKLGHHHARKRRNIAT